jgi:hypothetical protein
MELKTRFNIGDTVFVFKDDWEQPLQVTIDTVSTLAYNRQGFSRINIDYISHLENGSSVVFAEEQAYESLEEFISKIK